MTDKQFVHFFGEVVDKDKENLGISKPERISIDIYIEPSSVVAVRESIADDGDNVDGSIVYLNSGEGFWVEDIAEESLRKLGMYFRKNERITVK